MASSPKASFADAGDIDIAELSTIENQQLQIHNQLETLTSDQSVILNQLKTVLNSPDAVEPAGDSIIYSLPLNTEYADVTRSPVLKEHQELVRLSDLQEKLEKDKLLPTLNAGYNNLSIIGWQATGAGTERYYGSKDRFSYVSVGLGIPVFYGRRDQK